MTKGLSGGRFLLHPAAKLHSSILTISPNFRTIMPVVSEILVSVCVFNIPPTAKVNETKHQNPNPLDGWLRMGLLPPPLGNFADISYLVEN